MAVKELRGPVALVAAVGLLVVACWVAQALLLMEGLLLIFRREPISALVPLLAALMAVAVLRSFLLWLREIAAQHAGLIIKSRLRVRLIGHLVELGPAYTVGSRTGNLQAIVVDGVEGLEGYYARYLPQLIVALLGPLWILGYLVTVDPLVAAVIGVFVVAVPLAPRMWDRRLADRARSHWGRYRELKSDYVDGMQGMTTLKSLNAAGRYRTALHARAWELFRSTMRQLAMSLVGTGLTALMIAVGKAAAIATAVVAVSGGRLDVAGVLTVLLLAAECFRPFADLATYWHLSYVGFSAAEGISTLLAARPLPGPAVGRRPVGSTVELRGITFGYPGADSDVLVDLDLRVASGETVALLGESGAGKSTVLNLLLRFYDPRHGSVLIGGVDLREVDPVLLRRTIALVPQDIYLFHGTVVDNIRMGRPDATDAEVRTAAEAANAAEFIERLPDGYHSQVDERGLTLSGGELQRLAIARAFLRDAPILVLDEPTSSLDSCTAAAVHETLARLMRDRTTILITHRVTSARLADRIMVLRGGCIVESGSHTELWNRRGDYQRMLAVQGGGR